MTVLPTALLTVAVLALSAYVLLFSISVVLIPGFAVRPAGDPQDADCYIVMGFGLGDRADGQIRAGESNRALAQLLLERNEQGKPAIVQYGVFLGIQELLEGEYVDRNIKWLVTLPHDDHYYVDTRIAAFQSLALMHRMDLKQPALIAHPDQLGRVVSIFRHVPLGGPPIVPSLPHMPYDRRSAHPWTHSREAYRTFELFVSRPRTVFGMLLC